MVSLADDPQNPHNEVPHFERRPGWSEKPEGWDEPLDADGICGYVSDRFLPCELPKGHDGPHALLALNPELGPEAAPSDPSTASSDRPSSPDETVSGSDPED